MVINKKKISGFIILGIIVVVAIILFTNSAFTVMEDEYGIVKQFGKVVSIKENAGLYFKIPFVENSDILPRNKRMYDVPPSDVLTKDKKALVVDNYVVWRITDPLKFVQSVGRVEEMEKRIDAATYSVVKNTMGTKEQTDIIRTGVDGRNQFNELITGEVNNQLSGDDGYGVEVLLVEVKRLDLPEANEAAVYARMISEREQMAATYKAEGQLEAAKVKNNTDKNATIIISEANAKADKLKGEGEASYMKILGEAYKTSEQQEFYSFYRSLDAMRESLKGKGDKTLILPRDSIIAKSIIG